MEQTDKAQKKHFSKKNVRKGFFHYLLGKGLVSVIAFVVAIIVIRELEIAEYASYTGLTGLLLLMMLVSNLGLERAIPKFISEGLQIGEINRVVFLTILFFAVKLASLVIVLFVLYVSAPLVFSFFNVPLSDNLLYAFLLCSFFFGISMHVQKNLQAMLQQKTVAIGYSMDWFVRLGLLLLVLYYSESLSLVDVFLIQLVGLIVGVLYTGSFLLVYINKKRVITLMERHNVRLNRVFKFSLHNYLQALAGVHMLPSTGKLFAASLLVPTSVAFVGFAYALTGAFKRYLPAQLLLGLIEPVIMGRYAESKDFKEVELLTGMLLKLNLFLILPAIIWLMVSGEGLMNLISNYKYGEATWVVGSLLFILVLESQRSILQLICNTLYKSQLLLYSNLVTLVFVPLLLFMTINYDIVGMILGIIFLYWVRNVYIEIKLQRLGIYFKKDWLAVLKIISIAVVSAYGSGFLVQVIFESDLFITLVSLILMVFIYLLLGYLFKPFTSIERNKLNDFLGKKVFFW